MDENILELIIAAKQAIEKLEHYKIECGNHDLIDILQEYG